MIDGMAELVTDKGEAFQERRKIVHWLVETEFEFKRGDGGREKVD